MVAVIGPGQDGVAIVIGVIVVSNCECARRGGTIGDNGRQCLGKAELVIDINLELRIAIGNGTIRGAPLIQAIQGEINFGSVASEAQVGPGVLAVALAAVAEGTQETAVVIATADGAIGACSCTTT